MDKGSNSRSQSGGASNNSGGSSQARGGNSSNRGGSGSSGYSNEAGERLVRQISRDMAKSASSSYTEQQFLAQYFYDKYMDGSYG